MNMAALWKLPVIYVCENNLYNEYTHFSETTAGTMSARPRAFGILTEEVDGQDVRAVYNAVRGLVASPAGRRAGIFTLPNISLLRPSRRRRCTLVLSFERRGRAVEVATRPIGAAFPMAD